MKRAKRFLVPIFFLSATLSLSSRAETNLVSNGSFEQRNGDAPTDWTVAGNPAIKQQVQLATGRNGKPCAKLICSEFQGDAPDSHAMLCQVGKVAVRQGQWYRLSFWSKAEGLKSGGVDVALSNTRLWENTGLNVALRPTAQWQSFSFLFRARDDLPASDSRLQFWFRGTGTLWLDDVILNESAEGQQWFPQLASGPGKNLLPNSSFECGLSGWGSFTYGLSGWAGNLYRLEGEDDHSTAYHGHHSLKLSLSPQNLPVYYFDYYDPVRQPVRRILAADQGWIRAKAGEPFTLSAWLRADTNDVVAQLVVNEAPEHLLRKQVTVGREWQRQQFTFTPTHEFFFIAIGLDLEASHREAATLWLDAVQLERGREATPYEPCQAVESFVDSPNVGNIFTNAKAGLSLTLRAFNNSDRKQTVHGQLSVTDFFDQTAWKAKTLELPPHSDGHSIFDRVAEGKKGSFRAAWTSGTTTQYVRCAIIEPAPAETPDSPLGFNHAYPWDFLVQLAQEAGVVWWRDWSAKWQTVEPERGRFDFSVPDVQIERLLALNCQIEVLLPFPSASWSANSNMEEVEKAARGDAYLKKRLPLAFAPKETEDFGRYAAAVAQHYLGKKPRPITCFQILNEPLYTDYSLPRKFGYKLADYLQLLASAERALHKIDPMFLPVVGGISAGLDAGLTKEFVTEGGLRYLNVFDLHMYDAPRPAETFLQSFESLQQLMLAHGGPKPIWITEWGCYADDDPACVPTTVGDETMNRCCWPSERAATEHIVKFTAIAFAHGVRKIFFHAGTCGTINGPDAGGVLFEYGGAPRKMYPGVAALCQLLGVPEAVVRQIHQNGLHACVFRRQQRTIAIAWCEPGRYVTVQLDPNVKGFDIMGNALTQKDVALSETPIYLVGARVAAVLDAARQNQLNPSRP